MVFEILGVNLLEVIKRYEFKGVRIMEIINFKLDSVKSVQKDSQIDFDRTGLLASNMWCNTHRFETGECVT